MKYYIIAGEPSGDLHGANLMKALKAEDSDAKFRAWGGDKMAAEGAELVKHIRDLAFMGFAEVIMNLRTILNNIALCKSDIAMQKPDVVIMIDYPGFNLRMAKFVHGLGIPVFYYICPQIWAWKESRYKKIKAYVDKCFVILPFEKQFYADRGIDAEFVGHPLLDEVQRLEIDESKFRKDNGLDERPIVALLPGSRGQEIAKSLPLMLDIQSAFPDYQFVVSKVNWQSDDSYRAAGLTNEKSVTMATYPLLQIATAAIVTSGTATLETALFGVPEVVVYKGNWISIAIARLLVKIKFISLVNLVMDEEIVVELIQGDFNKKRLKAELEAILPNGEKRAFVEEKYGELATKLGQYGAAKKTASLMLKTLNELCK